MGPMFGTFEPEVSQVKFGLVNNVNTFNPVKLLLWDGSPCFMSLAKATI